LCVGDSGWNLQGDENSLHRRERLLPRPDSINAPLIAARSGGFLLNVSKYRNDNGGVSTPNVCDKSTVNVPVRGRASLIGQDGTVTVRAAAKLPRGALGVGQKRRSFGR
jgi:hypothetical protein